MAITRYRGLRNPLFAGMLDLPDWFSDTMLDFPRWYRDEFDVGLPLAWHPPVDMYEFGDNVYVRIDLPGLSKDDIDISFDGHILSVSGRRKEETEGSEICYWSRERFMGDFHRYVHIPGEVVSDNLKATFHDGVLEIALPKSEKSKTKKIAIESGEK